MWVWSKLVAPSWLEANEETLRQSVGNNLAVISRPGHKRVRLEVAFKAAAKAREFGSKSGGRIEKLPHEWLRRYSAAQAKPLRIGRRLVITRNGGFPGSCRTRAIWKSPFLDPQRKRPVHLIIPAGLAFGTGEHVTTAMALRILEEITRHMKPGWSAADIGTGSGVLALAAKCFGAGRVVALDIDGQAISTARRNARLNEIRGIDFREVDARQWSPQGEFDIVVANLFSELAIEILPALKAKLRRDRWMILSGILRMQEREVSRVLRRNGSVSWKCAGVGNGSRFWRGECEGRQPANRLPACRAGKEQAGRLFA